MNVVNGFALTNLRQNCDLRLVDWVSLSIEGVKKETTSLNEKRSEYNNELDTLLLQCCNAVCAVCAGFYLDLEGLAKLIKQSHQWALMPRISRPQIFFDFVQDTIDAYLHLSFRTLELIASLTPLVPSQKAYDIFTKPSHTSKQLSYSERVGQQLRMQVRSSLLSLYRTCVDEALEPDF